MASVNGITLKALKTFKDHEGMEIAQGNLYIGRKKIGSWSQDAWGGPDIINLDPPYDERKLEQCFMDRGFENLEMGLWRLLSLKQDEDLWKSSGSTRLFIADDGYHQIWLDIDEPETTVDDVLRRGDVLRCIDQHFFKNGSYNFRIVDESSFDEGEPITLEEITTKRAYR